MRTWKNIVLLFFCSVNLFAQNTDDQIYLADPTIFLNEGTYYLYGTKGDNTIEGEGFLVYTSQDLKTWKGPAGKKDGFALKKGDAFGTKGFWAPQVFKFNSKYYMAYTANENIAIASSESPLGPFVNDKKALEASVKQIDPFIFFDDGKAYLFHVRLQNGNRIFVAEMTSDLKQIKAETLTECITAEKGWENTQNADWPVSEGPTVIKKDNLYYLLYSANDFRNPDYAVGYATSESLFGPWIKSKTNPIMSKENLGLNGTGHGDLFLDKNGRMNYVLHTHLSDSVVAPRKTALVKVNLNAEGISIRPQSFEFLKKQE
ncbi:glycoside hydrolase family 43 protein [Leeuwenhoekiella sp. A16]|uniref:glycoside hydrolase family 43 protein n=1 Tax=unclassified Leeuwenhoekiella TaxID=2615029 RepID=UPI003A805F87